MNIKSNRERLLASTILVGATTLSLMSAGSALAQSTEPTTGNTRVVTTQPNGQENTSARVENNAGGIAAPGDSATQVGEVVVTGSRISRRDYVADSPVVSVGPKAIENTGAVTLDRLFAEIPQFTGSFGSQNNNPGTGQTQVQLRGLGTTRTLVLVDGRRATPSNVDGTIDINTIPQALIDNIEVVTGGQSTSYGSDAIAGVVNFKLKHNFQGVVLDTQYGISDQGDAEEQGVSLTVGSNFAEDRGNAVISLSYSNRDPVLYGDRPGVTSPDFATIAGLTDPRLLAVSGASGTKPQGTVSFLGNNLPQQGAINTLFGRYGVPAGTANTIKPNFQLGFNNDGTLFNGPANYKGPTSIDFSTIPGGPITSNGGAYNTGALNYITLPLTRYSAFGNAEYAITPHIKAYAQFNFTDYSVAELLAPSPASGNPTTGGTGFLVPANNPFIPADLRTLLNSRADPNAPFVFNKRFSDLGGRRFTDEYTTYQMLTGIKGDVPGKDLTYDIFASYGHLNDVTNQTGGVSHTNARLAFENPSATPCSSYNPFGTGANINAACAQFLSPTAKNQVTYTQRVVEADFQGHLFTLPSFANGVGGGDVRFAFGADYRDDRASFNPDNISSSVDNSADVITVGGTPYTLVNATAGVIGPNGGNPTAGDIDVYEVYGELLVPLLKDLPFFKSLNLDLGARDSTYSTVGEEFTYKADLEWKVVDWLLLRGGYSRAIRAPNVGELFTPPPSAASNGFFDIGTPGPTAQGLGDPCDVSSAYRNGPNAARVRALCLAQGVPASVLNTFQQDNTQVQSTVGGNPNLRAERSNTYTGGFVVQPHFSMPLFSHLSASVDYYNLNIRGYINTITPQAQLQSCFNASGATNPTYSPTGSLCNLFVRDPTSGQIVNGTAPLVNLGALRTSGVDFQVDWSFGLSSLPYLGLGDRWGSLAVNFTANWLNKYDQQLVPGGQFLSFRDSIGSTVAGGTTGGSGAGNAFPVWRALLNTNYSIGPFDIGVVERYIGEARDASCVGQTVQCTARGADPTFYTDINGRWKINDTLELRAGVANATNQDPRFFASGLSSGGQTDPSTYDLIGRRYYVGLKARF